MARQTACKRTLASLVSGSCTSGLALGREERRALEDAFGVDLSALRIHTDADADGLVRALGADAITCANHVFFRQGAFDPGSDRGLRLLVHEIAHAVQQATGVVTHTGRSSEVEAEGAADRVLAGQRVAIAGAPDAVRPAAPGQCVAVQRHDSFEHRALGDLQKDEIYAIAASSPNRDDLLRRQAALMKLWQSDPMRVTEQDLQQAYPGVRTARLTGSELLVTYGELNALPDYVANPAAIDTLPQSVLLPILQAVRQESYNRYNALAGNPTSVHFASAPFKPDAYPVGLVNKVLETLALDVLTRDVGLDGTDHYQGLLARNACHFAPFSWHRWQAPYLMACAHAKQAHAASEPAEKARLTHLAWLYHGYADHFLQDSFAAGHLTNKTLVMQWFIEWAADSELPIFDWDVIKNVTSRLQPRLAGLDLFDPHYSGASNDPQTVEEQTSYWARLQLSGVMPHGTDTADVTYQQYLTFLSSTIAQAMSGAVHDHFNASSLWVASADHPDPYEIWGDNTLLNSRNGGTGAYLTSETAEMSRESINELLATGNTSITAESIRSRFPTQVRGPDGRLLDLQVWQTGLRQWVIDNIFTWSNVQTLMKRVVMLASPRIENVSRDQDLLTRWTASLKDAGFTLTDVVMSQGRLLAGSAGHVYELAPTDGTTVRASSVADAHDTYIAADGKSLFVGCHGYVYGIDLSNLSRRWKTPMKGTTSWPVHVLYAGGRLFAGSNGTALELDPATGRVVNAVTLTSFVTVGAEVRLATDGHMLFAGCHGYAYGVNLANWSKYAWATAMSGVASQVVDVLAANGRLFAGSNGYVHELAPASGQMVHALLVAGTLGVGDYQTRLATDGHTLYAGTHGYVYAVSLGDWSRAAWTTPMSGKYYSAVDVDYDRGQLFAGSNGYLHRIDPATGRLLRAIELSSIVGVGDYAPRVVPAGELGLFVGMHGYVYRLSTFQPSEAREG